MSDTTACAIDAMPERSLRLLLKKVGLAEHFRLKFAACGFLSIDFITSTSDTLIGFFAVMEAVMGEELREQLAKFACLAPLGQPGRRAWPLLTNRPTRT